MAEMTNRQFALHEATALWAAATPHGRPFEAEDVLDVAAVFEEWLNRQKPRDDSEVEWEWDRGLVGWLQDHIADHLGRWAKRAWAKLKGHDG